MRVRCCCRCAGCMETACNKWHGMLPAAVCLIAATWLQIHIHTHTHKHQQKFHIERLERMHMACVETLIKQSDSQSSQAGGMGVSMAVRTGGGASGAAWGRDGRQVAALAGSRQPRQVVDLTAPVEFTNLLGDKFRTTSTLASTSTSASASTSTAGLLSARCVPRHASTPSPTAIVVSIALATAHGYSIRQNCLKVAPLFNRLGILSENIHIMAIGQKICVTRA